MTEVVLVTGAAGFIGRALVRAFAAEGHRVLAAIHRTPLPDELVADPAVTPVAINLIDREPRVVPKGGAEAPAPTVVVHAAYGAASGPSGDVPPVLAAADALGVRRVVYFSSIAYYGARTGEVTETTPPEGEAGAYGRQKQAGEAALAAWAATPGRSGVALRPGAVYGPDSTFWTVKLLRRIASGNWGRFGSLGSGPCPLVHVTEVASATVAAAGAPDGFQAFNIVADDSLTWNDYFTRLADAAGLPLRDLSPTEARLRVAASIPAKVWRKLGGPGFEALALAPTAGELATFARPAHYVSTAARETLGWTPDRDVDAAIAEAVRETRW
ncbi:hypothetical protein DLJ53_30850 [Acuticoccus sediminis]|uniref:NAD-dependent epimerase/dehydratase domain-containing protein n=1 Tax=Acuticoccus sediminis TaxID=2184697 RepID=A0A8B2NE85_9HYPH|nr:NAD(P)-dependent oxidoreductase [Acuticoccus sediminis]RAH97069.1 hypothetical protein DLJ53_30850 [Acuticoccus sediminis]